MSVRDELSRPRLTAAGIALVVGLLVEAVTLYWPHPTAFLTFLGLGTTLVCSGALLYLWLIVSGSPAAGSAGDGTGRAELRRAAE